MGYRKRFKKGRSRMRRRGGSRRKTTSIRGYYRQRGGVDL